VTAICHNLPRFTRKCLFAILACRGTQKVSLSNAISLLKSRILPQFAAICWAEKLVKNL